MARLNKTIDRALSAGRDTSIRLWDLSTGKSVQTFRGLPRPALAIEFLGDTPIAIVAENDNSFCLWNLSLGEKTAMFHGHTDLVTSVAISDGGKTVVSGGKDGTVRWWDLESGRCLRTFEGHVGKVNTVTVSQDGRRALSGGDDGTMRLWNLVRGPSVPFVIAPTARRIARDLWALSPHLYLVNSTPDLLGNIGRAIAEGLRALAPASCRPGHSADP